MTRGTQETKILGSVVIIYPINMLELEHDFLVVPQQYTITLCESLVLACGTLIIPIKIAHQSFFDFL
jgi:hypothetical protein